MNFKKPLFWDLSKPNFISYLLIPFTLPIILRNFIFKYLKKEKSQYIKTICVGNIYLGGTGKTPLTIKIYEILKKLDKKVATVKKYHSNQIDEQNLLKEKTTLFTVNSRKNAIHENISQNFEFLIFDDGLQDTKIDYDYKLVCFKSKNWIGNGQLIPAGPLREKISSLKKFDAIFLNGNSKNIREIENQIKSVNSKIKIFKTFYKILNIDKHNLNSKYLIFSGIGNPSDFKDILIQNKFDVVREMIFPDHYEYGPNDFKRILDKAKIGNLRIITTEKDYMKVRDKIKKEIDFLSIDLIIQNEDKLINLINN